MKKIVTLANSHVCRNIKRLSLLFILFAISACDNNTSKPQNWFFGEWRDVNDSDYTVKITEDNICINGRIFSWIYSSEDELYIGRVDGGDYWEMEIGVSLWEDEESIFAENRELKRIGRKPKKPANNIMYSNEQDYSMIYGTWVSQDSPSQVLIIKKNTVYDCNQEREYNCAYKGNVINILEDSSLSYEIGKKSFYGYDYSITDYQGVVFTKRSESVRYPRTRAQKMKDYVSGKQFSYMEQISNVYSQSLVYNFNDDGTGILRFFNVSFRGYDEINRESFSWRVDSDGELTIKTKSGDVNYYHLKNGNLVENSGIVFRED